MFERTNLRNYYGYGLYNITLQPMGAVQRGKSLAKPTVMYYWSEPLFLFVANPEADAEAEAEEEMDIDDTTTGTVGDESAYIGDNCLSTPVSYWDTFCNIFYDM